MREATAPRSTPPSMLLWTVWLTLGGLFACESERGARTIEVPGDVMNVSEPALTAACDGKRAGAVCATGRHCEAGDCVFDVCGDGLLQGDELCDDGNLALGDGCSPTCTLELVACPGSGWVKLGEACGDPDADGGSAREPLNCPKSTALTWAKRLPQDIVNPDFDTGLPFVVVGERPVVRARAGSLAKVMWVARPENPVYSAVLRPGIDPSVFTSERFTDPTALSTEFTCEDDLDLYPSPGIAYDVGFFLISDNGLLCPTQLLRFQKIQCRVPGFSQAFNFDASTPTSTVDAGPRDGGAGTSEGGTVDGSVSDAGPTDAGVTPDGGAQPGFRRPACEACMKKECAVYGDFDFIGPCLAGTGFDSAFAAACSAAYFCSHRAADGCADNTVLGPIGCFCGVGVELTTCSQSPNNVLGACKAQWYTAAHCASNDPACVLREFDKLDYPSGYANALVECQLTMCRPECAP